MLDARTNECQAIECGDGSLLLNMRSYHGKNRRAIQRSKDGGLTWSKLEMDEALIEPVCEGKITQQDAQAACAGYANPIRVPPVGTRVTAVGAYVLDNQHGWMELHPLFEIRAG